MVHPVDPSNTATSVAAAAPAVNIRRLVLLAFIGRASDHTDNHLN
jgi:hypothetical protein